MVLRSELEAREAVDGGEAYDGTARRNHSDCLSQLAASGTGTVPQIHSEVEQSDEDNGAANEGEGLRAEPDEFFQYLFTVLPFLLESRITT